MSVQKLLEVAADEIGYVEQGGADGCSGNITKYWDWWDFLTGEHDQGASWCGCFVSWCFATAGEALHMGDKPGYIYCPAGEAWFADQGRLVDPAQAEPGDVAFFHFANESNEANHTGIVESVDLVRRVLICIEGNTSSGATGSQSNGGGVYRRTRSFAAVRSVGKPVHLDAPQEDFMRDYVVVDVPSPRPDGAQVVAVPGHLFSKTASVTIKANDNGTPVAATAQICAFGDALLVTFVSTVPGQPVPPGKVGLAIASVA